MDDKDLEWANERIKNRDEMLRIRWAQIEKLQTRSSFWHGKWAIVCHENNVLRRENAELRRLVDRHDRDYMESQKQVDRLTADNTSLLDDNVRIALERDRLRELLRDAQQMLATALVTLQEYDVYRKWPVTAAKWAELREKINAELAKGE